MADPAPRRFGAHSQAALVPPPPQRTRSASSTSSATPPAFDITLAADKAQQWLSTWAPRGEGKGRDFIINGLNGVASVASTVSSGLNTRHGDGELSHFANRSTSSFLTPSNSSASPSTSPDGRFSISPPPLGPLHAHSTPQLGFSQAAGSGKRPPQPANLARLGHSVTTPAAPVISNGPSGLGQQRPKAAQSGSTSSLPTASHRTAHGPSHLGPNVPAHRRTSSSHSYNRPASLIAMPGTGSKSPSMSRSSSMTGISAGPSLKSAGMPYKPGFQPQGVRSDRTEEFISAREDLVDLHFNPTITQSISTLPRSSSSSFSFASAASDKRRSIMSIDGALEALKPKDMFKGFKAGSGPGGDEGRRRAAEQTIVKWEDDSEVKKCRICSSSFSLSNRKHHCRLCGRIVCSLPPTPAALLAVEIQLFAPADPSASNQTQAGLPIGTRRERCSLLLVADWKTGRGEEVEEGFVGWMKTANGEDGEDGERTPRPNETEDAVLESKLVPQQPKEVQVKGMRVCRECWSVVSRKQTMQDRQRVSGFTRLYQALRMLQSEIEEISIELDDLLSDFASSAVQSSSSSFDPSPELLATHRQLVSLFTQYEHLSKRLCSLPCLENSGSQAVVQGNIARSAAAFMAHEMGRLQAIPRLQKRAAEAKKKGMVINEVTLAQLDLEDEEEEESGADDVAVLLQPLLEQEAQLELYISDANAQRKYEDSKALQEALNEIRAEIGRVTLGASQRQR
ncbi:hypothetical protein L198_00308 [Cryptococcus wingfieldii CBS 7118]|uniref:FYVE-type domain-containing protein n=1 Tax=Cryptococcus wingfieldii CBS 7118 TaxID=1295528 RepID=A0A1E3K5Y0_9TREE|nr:hypothetical protein L198_00308 [Cryptococcus wingfieldii CBS 7118]ODO08578.1 hypothetical protein L198_00308 [Cryptococcus wingfieldii CBS 7118]